MRRREFILFRHSRQLHNALRFHFFAAVAPVGHPPTRPFSYGFGYKIDSTGLYYLNDCWNGAFSAMLWCQNRGGQCKGGISQLGMSALGQ
jgi:hypothetical protein